MNLKNCLIRQAFSLGLEPNSAEFRKFVWQRMVEPERNLVRAVKGRLVGGNATDIEKAMDEMDMNLIHFMHLHNTFKAIKRNTGLSKQHMAQILGLSFTGLQAVGRHCVQLMVSDVDPVEQFLTGNQDYDSNCAPDPDTMHGHRSSVGFIG